MTNGRGECRAHFSFGTALETTAIDRNVTVQIQGMRWAQGPTAAFLRDSDGG